MQISLISDRRRWRLKQIVAEMKGDGRKLWSGGARWRGVGPAVSEETGKDDPVGYIE